MYDFTLCGTIKFVVYRLRAMWRFIMSIVKANELVASFKKRGFHYSSDLLFNYYNSLITKPFVILTGISGSGKSKIAEIFSEIISEDNEKQYELIPVKPNWRDNKGLFGYHNLIDNSYYVTPLIGLFIKALCNPDKPYFLILDEMNIAKTEHYFADYLSLIESRRVEESECGPSLADLKLLFSYNEKISLSEAIILAALDIKKPTQLLKVEEYRNNRFVELWKDTFYGGNNWTAQFRSELNQGDGRLAYRVFEGGNGEYKMKAKSDMSVSDLAIVERLERMYDTLIKRNVIVQDNIVLHNSDMCLAADGTVCSNQACSHKKSEKYKCDLLYDATTEHIFVPAELPIPLNVFTVGTVNVDETTYMFSPKVLDRSNVIEFNEVDFTGLYNLSAENNNQLKQVDKCVKDSNFFFDIDADMPAVKITMPSKEHVNRFIAEGKDEFDVIVLIFTVLKKYNMHFGYRVINEIAGYMCNVYDTTRYVNKSIRALDNQILQKILPKFYGSYDKIWRPLVEVLSLCTISEVTWKQDVDADGIISELKRISANKASSFEINSEVAASIFKYPKTALKILEMLEDLNTVGFATFIK